MRLIILFGLSAAGKTYIGKLMQAEFNFHFWDADDILTQEMKNAIKTNQLFSQEMRNNYIRTVIGEIQRLKLKHNKIVISQALYKEINRLQLLNAFPEATFVWVVASSRAISERVKNSKRFINAEYAEIISHNFEIPKLEHKIICNNDNEASLIKQIRELISLL